MPNSFDLYQLLIFVNHANIRRLTPQWCPDRPHHTLFRTSSHLLHKPVCIDGGSYKNLDIPLSKRFWRLRIQHNRCCRTFRHWLHKRDCTGRNTCRTSCRPRCIELWPSHTQPRTRYCRCCRLIHKLVHSQRNTYTWWGMDQNVPQKHYIHILRYTS